MQNEMIQILLIEDDPAETGLIREMLVQQRRQEYSVEHVEYLADALALLENRIFDCILVDLGLPDSQGLETALAVRNRAKLTPVAIITILDDEELALKALEMDIQDYLVKGEINGPLLARSISYAIQRKHVEDALRFSEARYRSLFCGNPLMIVTLDADWRMLSVNPACANQLGYTIDELEGQSVLKLFHPDDRPAVAEQLRRCMEHPDQVFNWQFRKIRKNREMLWVEETAQAAPDLNGSLNLMIACQDITQRKRAEEALIWAKEEWERTFDSVPDLIAILDDQNRIMRVNRAMAERLGRQPEECVGLLCYQALHEAESPPSYCPHTRTAEDGRRHDAEAYVARLGGEFLVSTSPLLGPDGIMRGVVHVARDISERKRAEEALKNSEEKLRFASKAADVGMWHWNLVNNDLSWDDRCKEFFGYPPDYPMTYEAFLRSIHEEDRQGIDEAVHKALQEKTGYLVEMRVVLPDGQTRWVMSKGRAYYDEQGKPVRMHGIAMDITERKRAAEEIERLNTDLAARAFGLEVANRELEAFNYTVAHDLRKPLTVVNGYCQAIKELCSDKLDKTCRGYLREAYDGTLRMNRLIDSLLNFSRLAHVELRRESVDLSTLAHEVAAELQLSEPERRVTFQISDGISVDGDATLLRVTLNNLLGNAWKYTAMREEAVIEFGVTQFDGKTTFFVRDNGAGFAMEDAEKLFVPFQRLPGAEEFKGFGIGLATVARIIERHGGRLWAEGEPDKGATFWFTLG